MKLQSNNKIKRSHAIAMALTIFAIFVGLSCASAAAIDTNGSPSIDTGGSTVIDTGGSPVIPIGPAGGNMLHMSVKYNAGTGYHWEISPETYGVTLLSQKNVLDHPGTSGSSGTAHYYFQKESDNYYVKLVLISPTGKIVDSIDSNMLN